MSYIFLEPQSIRMKAKTNILYMDLIDRLKLQVIYVILYCFLSVCDC